MASKAATLLEGHSPKLGQQRLAQRSLQFLGLSVAIDGVFGSSAGPLAPLMTTALVNVTRQATAPYAADFPVLPCVALVFGAVVFFTARPVSRSSWWLRIASLLLALDFFLLLLSGGYFIAVVVHGALLYLLLRATVGGSGSSAGNHSPQP